MRSRRLIAATFVAVLMTLTLFAPSLAATFEDAENYELAAGETVEGNLYAFGDTVTINGTVTGDLVSAGRMVMLGPDGAVEGDVMAAGAEVAINGVVQGDVRAAGFRVHADENASIGGELISAGYSIEVAEGGEVDGTAAAAGYQGLLDGSFGGDLHFAGAALALGGNVAGDVEVEVGEAGQAAPVMFFPNMPALPRNLPSGLDVSDSAQIGGDMTVRTIDESDVDIPDSAVIGEIKSEISAALEEAEANRPSAMVIFLLKIFREFAGLVIFGLVALWLMPRLLRAGTDNIDSVAPASLGWGLLTVIFVPTAIIMLGIVSIILLILLGTISLGTLVVPVMSASGLALALLTAGFALLVWVARVMVSLWIGEFLMDRLAPDSADSPYVSLAIGAMVFAILGAIPLVGGLVNGLGVLLGLGAMAIHSRPHWPIGGTPAEVAPAA